MIKKRAYEAPTIKALPTKRKVSPHGLRKPVVLLRVAHSATVYAGCGVAGISPLCGPDQQGRNIMFWKRIAHGCPGIACEMAEETIGMPWYAAASCCW